jgi:hypothetical protein
MIKVIRHIQLNKISYSPTLFEAIITYEPYTNEYDESDEIELNKQKRLLNKLVKEGWFYKKNKNWGKETIDME